MSFFFFLFACMKIKDFIISGIVFNNYAAFKKTRGGWVI